MAAKRRTACARLGSIISGLALSLCVLAASQVFASEQAQARYASIIVDADTGEVLRSRNADTHRYPASLTKMMTLYLLFEAVDSGRLGLNSKLKVSKRAARQPASKLGLNAGSTIRVEDAVRALVVKSANDIAVVVAEALGKTEKRFAERMTRKARALGMSSTTFRNASGLPNRAQRSTARDMATLARALMRDFPHRYHYFDDQRFRYRGREHRTPNRLLGHYRGIDGIKTGYIRASGFNLVASAERNDRRIIAVVFGGKTARSRNKHMAALLDMGFERLASRRSAHNRLLVVGTPRPPSSSALAAPAPRHKPATIRLAAAPAAAPVESIGARSPEPVEIAASPLLPPVKPGGAGEGLAGAAAADWIWGVQVGAYTTVTAAEIALRRAAVRAPLLNGAAPTLVPRAEGRATLYRARFMGLHKNDANRACQTLRPAPIPCAVIRSLKPAPDTAARIAS